MRASQYFRDGNKIVCKECESDLFDKLAEGKTSKTGWYNLVCENGHFQTLYMDSLKDSAVLNYENNHKVKIVRHEVTRSYTKCIVLYLPEDEELDEHLPAYEDNFEYMDVEDVFQEHHLIRAEYDAAQLYDANCKLRPEWDPLRGKLTGPTEQPVGEFARPDKTLDAFLTPAPQKV